MTATQLIRAETPPSGGGRAVVAYLAACVLMPALVALAAFLFSLIATPELTLRSLLAIPFRQIASFAGIVAWAAGFGAFLFAGPVAAVIAVIRVAGWKRGWADVWFPASLGAVGGGLIFAGQSGEDLPVLGAAALGYAAYFGLGGLIYWLLAGRPK